MNKNSDKNHVCEISPIVGKAKYQTTPRRLRSKALRTEGGIDVHTVHAGLSHQSPILNSSMNSPGSSFQYSQDDEPDVIWDYSSPKLKEGTKKKKLKVTIKDVMECLNRCQEANTDNPPSQYSQLLDKWMSNRNQVLKSPANKEIIIKDNKRKNKHPMEKLKEFLETLPSKQINSLKNQKNGNVPSTSTTELNAAVINMPLNISVEEHCSEDESMEDLWGDNDNSFIVAATQSVDAMEQRPTKPKPCVLSNIPAVPIKVTQSKESKPNLNGPSTISATPRKILQTFPYKVSQNNQNSTKPNSCISSTSKTVPTQNKNHRNLSGQNNQKSAKPNSCFSSTISETVLLAKNQKSTKPNSCFSSPISETVSSLKNQKSAEPNSCFSSTISETVLSPKNQKSTKPNSCFSSTISETISTPNNQTGNSSYMDDERCKEILEHLTSIDWDTDEWEEAFMEDEDDDILSSIPEAVLMGKIAPAESKLQNNSANNQKSANYSSGSINDNVGLSKQESLKYSSKNNNPNIGFRNQESGNSTSGSNMTNDQRSESRPSKSSSQNTRLDQTSINNISRSNAQNKSNGQIDVKSNKHSVQRNISSGNSYQNIDFKRDGPIDISKGLKSHATNNTSSKATNLVTHCKVQTSQLFRTISPSEPNYKSVKNTNVSKPSSSISNLSCAIGQFQSSFTKETSSKSEKNPNVSKLSSSTSYVSCAIGKFQEGSTNSTSSKQDVVDSEMLSESTRLLSESTDLFGAFSEDDDDFEDELLCQPEVLSKIDEVESLLTQPPKCTPEEIQKKRDEALKRLKSNPKR